MLHKFFSILSQNSVKLLEHGDGEKEKQEPKSSKSKNRERLVALFNEDTCVGCMYKIHPCKL